MAWTNRDLRLPGQSFGYKDHPSNVGSGSYFADTGRGWVPNPGVSLNRQALNKINRAPSDRQPGIGVANRRRIPGAGITSSQRAQNYIEKATDEEKQAAFDHPAYAHLGPWWAGVMDKFGGLTKGALRGSRLHKDYKDEYGKIEGTKRWEADKRSMMTGYGKKKGDPGYEDSDQAFYDKYMNLASMATDNEKAAEYRKTAETAWRNKQTSDRLAAYTGFEGYDPGKYSGLGEGSRYTGDVYEEQGRTGKFVPGVGIMDDIIDRFSEQGVAPQDYEKGEHWDIAPDREFALGYEGNLYDREKQIKDLENQTIPDEIFEGITEDITADFGGNERFEEQLAAEQPLPWEAQRQKAIFRNRPQGVRGMLGYGMEFDRMAYPYGEDFQDSLDEFWDISPNTRSRMTPYS